MKKCIYLIITIFIASSCGEQRKVAEELHTIPCDTYSDVEAYFRYTEGCDIIISGHRGGNAPGYPENSIETFENTLRHLPSFFEIDPRMTKDSVMVLMHDDTIDRTTNGTGRVSDYTFDELQEFRLVDRWGTVTDFKIPSVESAIRWSKGKTILNFDKKDVTRDVLAAMIKKCGAENIIYTVHNAADALSVYAIDPNAHFSAFIATMDAFREYEATGIPWSRYIVYVENGTLLPEQQELYDALHKRGVRCMIALAPTHDRLPTAEERAVRYREEIAKRPDIIESDFPVEFVGLIKDF